MTVQHLHLNVNELKFKGISIDRLTTCLEEVPIFGTKMSNGATFARFSGGTSRRRALREFSGTPLRPVKKFTFNSE
jgi:hypothetical protein